MKQNTQIMELFPGTVLVPGTALLGTLLSHRRSFWENCFPIDGRFWENRCRIAKGSALPADPYKRVVRACE